MDTNRSYTDPSLATDVMTLAAAFADRDSAHDAIHRLHDEGFGETWLGITRSDDTSGYAPAADDTRVEADNWFMRFFGEGDESLHDALVRRGVTEADARSAGTVAAHSAIVTVAGGNHPELAAQIISECGGHLITKGFGSTGYGSPGTYAATSAAPTSRAAYASGLGATNEAGVDGGMPYDVSTESTAKAATPEMAIPVTEDAYGITATQDYGMYRGGKSIDEDTRLQLREERLRIDKERRSRGEATISKEVVTQAQEVDVPLMHEELFIERRPATSSAAVSGPIGSETEVVRIPLTEEKLNVSKVAVVTEEVVIGKRQVETTGHVAETTRKEQLNVQDVDSRVGAGVTSSDPII